VAASAAAAAKDHYRGTFGPGPLLDGRPGVVLGRGKRYAEAFP